MESRLVRRFGTIPRRVGLVLWATQAHGQIVPVASL